MADASDRDRAVADWLIGHLAGAQAAAKPGARISFMVSGGRSPAKVLAHMPRASDLDWGRIDVFASDERCVPVSHADSTEGMVRGVFADASVPLAYHGIGSDPTPERALEHWTSALSGLQWPAAAGLLGIGEDAHTASLFPDRSETTADGWVFAVPETAPHRHPRLTLGPRALRQVGPIALIVVGAAKHRALKAALAPDADLRTTPAAVLQSLEAVTIFQDVP